MTVSIQWLPGTGSVVMSTELNSLADSANALGPEIDNSSTGYLFDDVEWYNAALGYTPSTGAVIELYLIRQSIDQTTFEDGSDSIDPPSTNLVGVFNIRASTAAQRHAVRMIPIPPCQYMYLVINKTGGALAASGNLLSRQPYGYQTISS